MPRCKFALRLGGAFARQIERKLIKGDGPGPLGEAECPVNMGQPRCGFVSKNALAISKSEKGFYKVFETSSHSVTVDADSTRMCGEPGTVTVKASKQQNRG